MPGDHQHAIGVLRRSHDHLASLVEAIPTTALSSPSYCSAWSIAQCLSHLGSGAEISILRYESALNGTPEPTQEQFQAIWAVWDARSPEEMAANALVADGAYVQLLESTPSDALDAFSMDWFGSTLDAAAMVATRITEHALHTWDVEVTVDPAATVAGDAVAVIAPTLGDRMRFFARGDRPAAAPTTLAFSASAPSVAITIEIGEEVKATDGPADTTVKLPAEALVRLAYGRMDEAHTPGSVKVNGVVTIEELRKLFPGF